MADGPKDKPPAPVGYKQPPAEHQFKKGRSGNPLGRPRKNQVAVTPGLKPLLGADEPTRTMILQEAYRLVKIRDGDRVIEMPTNRAVFRAMAVAAMKGSRVAQRDWTLIVQKVEGEQKQLKYEYFQTLVEYKRDAEDEIARCARLNIEPPEMIPHPDDVIIDPRTGTADILGPMTAEEKVTWDRLTERRDEAQREVSRCAAQVMKQRSERMKQIYFDDHLSEQRMFDIVNDKLPKHRQVKLVDRSYAKGASQPGDGLTHLSRRQRKGRR